MDAYKLVTLIFEGVLALGALVAMTVLCVKFVRFLTVTATTLEFVTHNHLPHIEAELRGLREDFTKFLIVLGGKAIG
jgi:hypothetical protein